MQVTHRVKNSRNETVGFIVDNRSFYNNYYISMYVQDIDNIKITSSGIIRSKQGKIPEITLKQYNQTVYNEICKVNPFIRDIQTLFYKWKLNKNRHILQVEGPRQVGKTTEIKKLAYKHYEQVIYVNLADDSGGFIEKVVNTNINTLAMTAYCRLNNLPTYIDNNNTILIIDEIQISSKVYNSIRTFKSNLNCDIIVTGSYLGQLLNREFFQPAGTIRTLSIGTMSFREFCRVFKAEQTLMKIDIFGSSSDAQYNKIYELYNIYRKIGGYPDIVKEYVQTKDIDHCMNIIGELLNIFEKESRVYFRDEREVRIFNEVYIAVAQLICSDKQGNGNKTLNQLGDIVSKNQKTLVSREEISKAISWVQNCGIIDTCNLLNNGEITDIIGQRKIYFTDCGLANYVLQNSNYPESNTAGALTENFVYCELSKLYKNKSTDLTGNCPCFSTYGTYELDFIIVNKSRYTIGIEVKTQDGSHKSLNTYLSKKLIDHGIVAKVTKGGHSDKFDTIPIFAVGCRYPYK